MIRLKKDILDKIKADKALKAKLQLVLMVGERSVLSYLEVNDSRLTELDSLNTIVEHMDVPLSSIVQGKYSPLIVA